MAVLRKQIQVKQLGKLENNIFDCLVSAVSDFSGTALDDVAPGSLAYCLEDGNIYAKVSASSWTAVTGSDSSNNNAEEV